MRPSAWVFDKAEGCRGPVPEAEASTSEQECDGRPRRGDLTTRPGGRGRAAAGRTSPAPPRRPTAPGKRGQSGPVRRPGSGSDFPSPLQGPRAEQGDVGLAEATRGPSSPVPPGRAGKRPAPGLPGQAQGQGGGRGLQPCPGHGGCLINHASLHSVQALFIKHRKRS